MDVYAKHVYSSQYGSSPTSSGSSSRRTFGALKIVKYLLLSTLLLLLIGTLTLVVRLFLENATALRTGDQNDSRDKFTIRLLTNYLCICLVTAVAAIATVKEHFFFLVTSASLNLTLSFVSVSVFAIDQTIALLQVFTSLLTFAYLLAVYLKMKCDIQRRRKLNRVRRLQSHFVRPGAFEGKMPRLGSDSLYYSSNASEHQYDKISLTSKWILNQQLTLNSNHHQLFSPSPSPQQ